MHHSHDSAARCFPRRPPDGVATRSTSTLRAAFIALLAVAPSGLLACAVGRPRDQSVQWTTGCQCGMCMTVRFCVDANGRFDRICDPGTGACPCAPSLRAQAFDVRTRERSPMPSPPTRLFCRGPVETATDAFTPAVDNRARMGALLPNPCFFTPAGWSGQFASPHPSIGSGLGYDAWFAANCPRDPLSHARSCDFVAGPLGDWGQRLECPGKTPWSAMTFWFNRANFPADGDVQMALTASAYLGSTCNLMSAANATDVSFDPVTGEIGVTGSPRYLCFIRDANGQTTTRREPPPVNAGSPLQYDTNPPSFDPGVTPSGHELVVDRAASTIRLRKRGGPTVLGRVAGTASARFDASPSDYFVVTDMNVQLLDVPITFDGRRVTEAALHLENIWVGAHDLPGPGRSGTPVRIPAASVRAQVFANVDGSEIQIRQSPVADVTGAWSEHFARRRLEVDLDFADGDFTYTFHVVFDDARPRPEAVILMPGVPSVERECTGPNGFLLDGLLGLASGSPGVEQWTIGTGEFQQYATGSTASFFVPLLGRDAPPSALTYSVLSGALGGSDSRTVRAVDTMPPVITSTTLDIGCEWGS